MTRLHNRTRGLVLATQLERARGTPARIRGLMFRERLPEGGALDINPCSSIHMMFMRFPIDAVFYDRQGRVTKVARRVRPWTGLAFGGKGARAVVELPAGAAGPTGRGDQLEFEEEPT